LGIGARQLLDECDVALRDAAKNGGELKIHEIYHTLGWSCQHPEPRVVASEKRRLDFGTGFTLAWKTARPIPTKPHPKQKKLGWGTRRMVADDARNAKD
jgi:hypothetical protein